jgi:hypothetical protein
MWADIRGYEGRYQVSTLGRVKSLARMRRGKSGCEVPVPEIIMALTPKKEKGLLIVGLRTEEQFIVCTITDNGIGRKKAAEIKRTMPGSKHKSMGMKITEERLRILNDISLSKHSVKITDLENENGESLGTKVEIYVPIM